MLRDDGERLGLHPRGQAGRREDGGTVGDNTPATLGAHWELRDAEERENNVVG